MPVKINQKKKPVGEDMKVETTTTTTQLSSDQETQSQESQTAQTTPEQQIIQPQQSSADLSNFLATMTQMMSQQTDMIKLMDERMKKLEEGQANIAKQEAAINPAEPEIVNINADNVATYNREDEEGYAEVINKVWKIMYITEQAPVMQWDAAPMMTTIEERRKVWNMRVSDTKYFDSEDEAKAYIENLRRKGINLPGVRIVSCYI